MKTSLNILYFYLFSFSPRYLQKADLFRWREWWKFREIADKHSDQSRVSYSKQLSPIPAMPEPQMHPYQLIKRYGNISKCHGCELVWQEKGNNDFVWERNGLVAKVGQSQVNKTVENVHKKLLLLCEFILSDGETSIFKKGKRDNYL